MKRESTRHEKPTRREDVRYGGAVVGGGLLDGCTSGSGEDPASAETEAGTETETETTSAAETDTTDAARIEPTDRLTHDVPETQMAITGHRADIVYGASSR